MVEKSWGFTLSSLASCNHSNCHSLERSYEHLWTLKSNGWLSSRLLFLLVAAASVLSQLSIGRVLSFVPHRMLIQVCLYFYCKFLWRCMKFVMRKLTGRCELQRICYGTKPGASRTMKIGEH